MHNAFVPFNNQTVYQASLGRQPHPSQFLEGGYHGDPDAEGQHNLARAREIVAVAAIVATVGQ